DPADGGRGVLTASQAPWPDRVPPAPGDGLRAQVGAGGADPYHHPHVGATLPLLLRREPRAPASVVLRARSRLLNIASDACSGAGAGNAQPDPVEPGLRRQVQGLPIVVAPTHVGRVLGPLGGAEVLALRREDPEPARAGHVEVATLVDLDPSSARPVRRP